MATLQEKLALREQGMTYQQIADHFGISYQAVANSLSKHNPRLFRYVSEEGCIYPNLRRWMNENKVGKRELLRRCGLVCAPKNYDRFCSYFQGKVDPPKKTIDKILRVTGLTYEEAFGKVENSQ